jgi:dTDP-4-amino-4,6-dideoxygalactose transaminase
MIPLFNINNHTIYTGNLGNHLHGPDVDEFVTNFCNHVGAKYGCAVNSATNAIFLTFEDKKELVTIPSVLPPVVFNALHHAGQEIQYKDDVEWVGGSYELHDFGSYKVIDSAQRVDRNQFKEANDEDLMLFSFYPTKPVGGIDGGIIVSNDADKIEYFKQRSLNGMSFAENNWDRKQLSIGWKMYMNSVQAFIANENLKLLQDKQVALTAIRNSYNKAFGLDNTSSHLYRVNVNNREEVIKRFKTLGIGTGIHYTPLHKQELYKQDVVLPQSEEDAKTTLSIPFNEKLTVSNVEHIISEVRNVIV